MSQNDFVIDNQTTPLFRADLNNALQALASNSSGPTEPSVTYANQFWYDESTDILKMRSEANDAWINIGTLNQSTNVFTPAGLTNLTQAQVEDAASTVFGYVSGQRLSQATRSNLNVSGSAPMFACRAWVNFNGTGTVSIRASGNVSSITDNGTGRYTVNFTVAMPDVNYVMAGSGATSLNFLGVSADLSIDRTTSGIAIRTGNTNTLVDASVVNVVIFR